MRVHADYRIFYTGEPCPIPFDLFCRVAPVKEHREAFWDYCQPYLCDDPKLMEAKWWALWDRFEEGE